MLTKKRLSSKINYDVLDKLFDESEVPGNHKKSRTEAQSDNDDDNLLQIGKKDIESKDGRKNEELELEDEYGDAEDTEQAYESNLYYENAEEGYDYDDDYGYDGL
ncbi:hypothetical protein U1Q18_007975 [Sarracenia purpurea var. burkii]